MYQEILVVQHFQVALGRLFGQVLRGIQLVHEVLADLMDLVVQGSQQVQEIQLVPLVQEIQADQLIQLLLFFRAHPVLLLRLCFPLGRVDQLVQKDRRNLVGRVTQLVQVLPKILQVIMRVKTMIMPAKLYRYSVGKN